MLEKASLSDYEKAFIRYRELAVNAGVRKVLQCGSVNNPGVSDIDCLLLIDDWKQLKGLPWKIFNPESISPLFTHGPFICLSAMHSSLTKYSTLREKGSDILSRAPREPSPQQKFIVAARQSRSIAHLQNVLMSRRDARSTGLLLKSLVYTLLDCLVFSAENDCHSLSVLKFKAEVDGLRKNMEQGEEAKEEIGELYIKAQQLINACAVIVSSWIEGEFSEFGSITKKQDGLKDFAEFIRSGYIEESPYRKDILSLRELINSMEEGYLEYGALYRGAELPFHQHDISILGWKIWLRRVNKGVARALCTITGS